MVLSRRGRDESRLVDPRRGDRFADNVGQPRIGRRIGELPIVADQLVAEVASPRFHRLAGRVVGADAVGADQQQRIRLAGLRIELALGQRCSRAARNAAASGLPGPSAR